MTRTAQASPQAAGTWTWRSDSIYDAWLIGVVAFLTTLGLIMVASASVSIADRLTADALHYFWRQLIVALFGAGVMVALVRVPLRVVERLSTPALFAGIALLVLVLIPGIGREVNGSLRWIGLGPVSLQASEPFKLVVIVYLASYLLRHAAPVRNEFRGFIKPIIMLTGIGGLLLLEPDYGAAVVVFATALGMLFLGGVPIARIIAWGLVASGALAALAVLAPYRLQRLMTFIDPWSDPYNTGFQLTQALIAFGRGEWLGVGLGSSIQKLFYLPEVHTDFIFAVIAEELGLAGSLTVLGAFMFLVWRIFHIGAAAHRRGDLYAAHVAFGVGLLIGLQAFINMGVNMGVLPTKGLTLPLVSYGANSMVVSFAALGLVMRIARETRDPALRARQSVGGGSGGG
jgi:cell division protein FtsW